jgi:hypothetical protein
MKRPPTKTPGWAVACALVARLAMAPAVHAVPVHSAQPDAEATASLDQIMAALRSVQHVQARYVEHRTLHALRTPIETRGTLRFDAPDQLEKASDPAANGASDRLTIKGNELTIDRGAGTAPVVLMLNEHPEIGVLIESIRVTLAGDAAALRQTFDISLAGTVAHWQLVLQPHDPAARKILLWMRITGYANRITAIDTEAGDGDHSEMSIVERGP